jgi:hypothetical protein
VLTRSGEAQRATSGQARLPDSSPESLGPLAERPAITQNATLPVKPILTMTPSRLHEIWRPDPRERPDSVTDAR